MCSRADRLAHTQWLERFRVPKRDRINKANGRDQAANRLHHLLEHSDAAGCDGVGCTAITLAVNNCLLKQLLTFDAGSEDLKDNGDGEPNGENSPISPGCVCSDSQKVGWPD